MLSDFLYIDEKINDKIDEKINRKSTRSGKIEKNLKNIIIIAVILAIAEIIWLYGIRPFVPFSRIEVEEIPGLNRADILYLARITETSSFFSSDVKYIKTNIENNILVESVNVVKQYPDKLEIYTNPRQAVAAALVQIGQKQKVIYVDRNGVFFKIEETRDNLDNIIMLSGIENASLGMRLPPELTMMMERIADITSTSPLLLSAISEIRIEKKIWDGYELVLIPIHSSIKVRVECNLSEAVLRYTLLMVNVLEKSNPKPYEVDFRSGIGSFKIKEPSI